MESARAWSTNLSTSARNHSLSFSASSRSDSPSLSPLLPSDGPRAGHRSVSVPTNDSVCAESSIISPKRWNIFHSYGTINHEKH